MSERIGVHGGVSVWIKDTSGVQSTVADVREWLKTVDALGIPDTHKLDDCALGIYVAGESVELIEDDRLSGKRDALLVMPRV